jgi:hypothetical protein
VTTHVSPKTVAFIRVNLRFGRGTNPALWNALQALPPYARAKLIRQLLLAGWRLQHDPDGRVRVNRESPVGSLEILPNQVPQADLREDIFALVGSAVRV